MPREHGFLRALYARIEKFDDGAAAHAAQVVVVVVPVRVFVGAGAVVLAGFARQARLGQEAHGAEHGGLPDARIQPPGRREQGFRGYVPLGGQEGVEHGFPRGGHFQAALPEP